MAMRNMNRCLAERSVTAVLDEAIRNEYTLERHGTTYCPSRFVVDKVDNETNTGGTPLSLLQKDVIECELMGYPNELELSTNLKWNQAVVNRTEPWQSILRSDSDWSGIERYLLTRAMSFDCVNYPQLKMDKSGYRKFKAVGRIAYQLDGRRESGIIESGLKLRVWRTKESGSEYPPQTVIVGSSFELPWPQVERIVSAVEGEVLRTHLAQSDKIVRRDILYWPIVMHLPVRSAQQPAETWRPFNFRIALRATTEGTRTISTVNIECEQPVTQILFQKASRLLVEYLDRQFKTLGLLTKRPTPAELRTMFRGTDLLAWEQTAIKSIKSDSTDPGKVANDAGDGAPQADESASSVDFFKSVEPVYDGPVDNTPIPSSAELLLEMDKQYGGDNGDGNYAPPTIPTEVVEQIGQELWRKLGFFNKAPAIKTTVSARRRRRETNGRERDVDAAVKGSERDDITAGETAVPDDAPADVELVDDEPAGATVAESESTAVDGKAVDEGIDVEDGDSRGIGGKTGTGNDADGDGTGRTNDGPGSPDDGAGGTNNDAGGDGTDGSNGAGGPDDDAKAGGTGGKHGPIDPNAGGTGGTDTGAGSGNGTVGDAGIGGDDANGGGELVNPSSPKRMKTQHDC